MRPELVVLVVLATILAVLWIARASGLPYPVLLVVAGLLVGSLPGMPEVRIDPEVVLLGVLPPLLFWPAFLSSQRELRQQAAPIAALAIGLVLATTVVVATLAHVVIGLRWDVAFVLGAVVSATDAVATTVTLRRLGAPRRVLVTLSGESLLNDAAALVAYVVAVQAVTTGRFSAGAAGLRFVLGALGGIAIGLAVGWLLSWVLRYLQDPLSAITLVLSGAYVAYLPAELLGASGVLAAVAAGLLFGWREPRADVPSIRLAGYAFWDELSFLVNALVFLAIGLQLPVIGRGVRGFSASQLAAWTALVVGAAVALRIVWVYLVVWRPEHHRDPERSWRECAVKAWAGMRGVVTVAAALAIPLTTRSGRPFPDRSLIIFIAYGTVLATLVLQGVTLPFLLRALRIGDDDRDAQEARARAEAAQAALARAAQLDGQPWVPEDCLEGLRRSSLGRVRRYAARANGRPDPRLERGSERCEKVRHELLEAERQALIRLREQGDVSEDVHQEIQRELDLAHARLHG